jgi:Trypsin
MGQQRILYTAALLPTLAWASAIHASVVQTESRPLYTTANDPALHETSPGGNFDSVVKLTLGRSDGTFNCTGTLLSNRRDILTAAHCLTDDSGNITAVSSFSLFQTPFGTKSLPSVGFTVHPNWNGDFNTGNDLAIIRLGQLAPLGADGYEIYRASDEVGQTVTKAGYGLSGTGDTGTTLPNGTKRSGLNTYDALGDVFTSVLSSAPIPGAQLAYDFDDGTNSRDAFGFFDSFLGAGNLNDTGLGNDEVMSAPGDSGGPTFINNQIAGVTSYGLRLTNFIGKTSDIDNDLNSSFGEFAIDTRVSFYANWIDANLSTPPPFIQGDLNGDGFVGIDDLNIVLNRWNQTVSIPVPQAGDPSGDNFVGIDDLNIVLSDWNQGTPPGLSTPIPEPASSAILCLMSCVFACGRSRR